VHAALRISDFVSMLAEGRIIESAPPEEFMKSTNPTVRRFLESAGVV
jgi:ABC-type transporter Mla maintaining outer membrane lipid asymmetry ATPase subunit MlaF